MNDSWFIALPLDAQNLTQQSNLQLLEKEKLTKSRGYDNQTGWDWFCMGNRTSSTQLVKYVGSCVLFALDFIL